MVAYKLPLVNVLVTFEKYGLLVAYLLPLAQWHWVMLPISLLPLVLCVGPKILIKIAYFGYLKP